MKTLYLHIGTPKTATSSIQKFLAENWDVLQKHGYFFPESTHIYPRVNARRNAHFLSGRVRNGEGIRDKEKEKTYLEEGLQQVRDAFQNYDNVILTDESIWYCLSYLKKSLLCDLKKEADKQGYQIKVIVYLRRQDKFLLSRWNQKVKQKSTSDAVLSCDEYFELTQKKEKDIYQYGKILDGIAEVIGKENLIVRRFDAESWRDGSIIHDFMHEIGIDVNKIRTKKTLHPLIQQLLKRPQNSLPRWLTRSMKSMKMLRRNCSENYIQKDHTEMLAKEELQQFLKKYETENERIAREYIGDGHPLFSNEVKDLPKWNPQNEKMQEEIIQFFAAVTMDLRRTNEIQRQKINQQEKRIRQLEKRANEFVMFRDKAKHPFRTIWKKLFR